MRLIDILKAGDPASVALVHRRNTLTYGALHRAAIDLSEALRRAGVHPGAKIMLRLPNSQRYLVALFAASDAGAILIPSSPALTENERWRLDDLARPDWHLAEHGDVEISPALFLSRRTWAHEEGDESDLSRICAILLTSGTTGAPKGAMMTDGNLLSNAEAVRSYLGLTHQDRTLLFLPLHYSYSLSQVLSTFLAGGTLVLMKNLLFPIQAFEAMEGYGVTGFGGVPATLGLLASHPAAARTRQDSLRYILSAGGPLAPSVVQRLKTAFPGADLFNNYGCTEIGPRATSVNYTEFPDRIGSIGRAIRGVEVRIVRQDLTLADAGETGEVVLTGASLMKGYYRDPGATARKMSRWGFHTGDFAHVDEDGFLYYEGRHDDIFKCAGEKLSAREVEDVLLEHEAVLEAAVTSMADAALGAVPIAHVVCRAECAPSAEELQVFCARRLSRYKVPRQILFVDALQRTATGKVQKFRLREARA